MTKKIESLTVEQEAMLLSIREEWLAHGLSTDPADRPAAEAALAEAYRAAKLDPPGTVVWLDSPLAGAVGATMLRGDQVGNQVRDQVRDQVWDQVRDQVRDQVWGQVGNQVRNQVRDQVWAQVWDQVWAQVGAQVWAQVWAQVRAQVRAQVGAQWHYGLINSGWLAYYASWIDAMARIGVRNLAAFDGLSGLAKTCGWAWAYRNVAILTDRPTAIHRDRENRLHCEDGPAITYRDGWSIYTWHGTRVPADLIETGWTVEQALKERNSEIRRAAVERIADRDGWAGIAREAGWPMVGEPVDDPGNPGKTLSLYHLADLYAEPVRLLVMTNGSPDLDGSTREYGEPVPANIASPVAAAAWQYDWPEAEYKQLARRT